MMPEKSISRSRSRRIWGILGSLAIGVPFAVFAQLLLVGFSLTALTENLIVVVIYILCLGGFISLLMPLVEQRIAASRFPLDWVFFVAVFMLFSGLGSAVASFILYAVGIVPNRIGWQQLQFLNRLILGITLVFGIFSFLFNKMRDRLETRNLKLQKDLEQESRQLLFQARELERAREIQEALLPKELPEIQGLNLSGTWLPAREVGGDYYDVLPFTDRAIGLCIADVVGKGIGAALLMSNLQAAVKAFASGEMPPAVLCEKVNQVIASHVADGKFITFFYGLLNPKARLLVYCCAGHNPPIVARRDGSIIRLDEGGPVLGVFPNFRYEQGQVAVSGGDRLVLFTDGVTEATNAAEEEFGDERLVDLVTAARDSEAPQLTRRILSAVKEFSQANLTDDVTLLAVSVT